jgi:hypothetical protein
VLSALTAVVALNRTFALPLCFAETLRQTATILTRKSIIAVFLISESMGGLSSFIPFSITLSAMLLKTQDRNGWAMIAKGLGFG